MLAIKSLISTSAVVAVIASTGASAHAAGSASLSLSTQANVTQGQTFSVAVYEAGATNAQAVTAKLSFDASQVALVGTSCGAVFTSPQPETNGVTCFVPNGGVYSGDATVGYASFQALTTGSTTISTAAGSFIAATGVDEWNGAISSTSISMSAPVAAPAPTPNPGRGSGNTSPVAASSPSAASTTTETPVVETPAAESTTPAATTKKAETPKTTANVNLQPVADTTPSPWLWVLFSALTLAAAGFISRRRVVAARATQVGSMAAAAAKVSSVAQAAKAKVSHK